MFDMTFIVIGAESTRKVGSSVPVRTAGYPHFLRRAGQIAPGMGHN